MLALIAGLTGMIMVLQIGPTLADYGRQRNPRWDHRDDFLSRTGAAVGFDYHPARVGSAIAAEVGTMVINEEVDALEVMGIDPVRYLWCAWRHCFCVAFADRLADVIGLAGGALVKCNLTCNIMSFLIRCGSSSARMISRPL